MTSSPFDRIRPVRPTTVTVWAIVGILFSVLGLMCNVLTAVQAVLPSMGVQIGNDEAARAMSEMPRWVVVFNVIISIAGFLIWLVWLVVCIALLRDARWSRRWGIKVATLNLVVLVLMTIAGAVVAMETKDVRIAQMRAHNRQIAAQQNGAPTTMPGTMPSTVAGPGANSTQAIEDLTERFALSVMFGGLACGFVFGALLPVAMSIVLRRDDVIAYYDADSYDTPPGYFPPPAPPQSY
jgi:cytochrome c biogenesis protein CcdA